MDSPDGHGRNEGHDNEGILEKKCDLVRNAIELIEQYCLVNLYSNQFFWNWNKKKITKNIILQYFY